tara:strand:+ start:1190 stop:2122 length:933 start_codon:yes stop_codon:yes gene_type:complete
MYEEILSKLKQAIKREENIELDISKFNEIKDLETNSAITFIDGGSAEIFNNINMSFGIIRTAFATFQKNIRSDSKTFDFYFLIKTINKEDKVLFNAEVFNFNNKDNILSETIFEFEIKETSEHHNTEITKISDNLRRLLEIKTAEFIQQNQKVDFIVLDGNLQIDSKKEKEYLGKIHSIQALSKSSHVISKQGLLYSNILNNNKLNYTWYYELIDNIYFTKLNKNSKHIFKVETKNTNTNPLFSILKNNSKDPVFLGYPYGLIEVDRLARISNNELNYLKNLFTAKLGKIDLTQILSNSNAHEILDNISF